MTDAEKMIYLKMIYRLAVELQNWIKELYPPIVEMEEEELRVYMAAMDLPIEAFKMLREAGAPVQAWEEKDVD